MKRLIKEELNKVNHEVENLLQYCREKGKNKLVRFIGSHYIYYTNGKTIKVFLDYKDEYLLKYPSGILLPISNPNIRLIIIRKILKDLKELNQLHEVNP